MLAGPDPRRRADRARRARPGLSDLPLIGRLFATHHKESQQTDIILTLTPHIVRVLDLSEADLRPFRLGRDSGSGAVVELPNIQLPPRDRDDNRRARRQPARSRRQRRQRLGVPAAACSRRCHGPAAVAWDARDPKKPWPESAAQEP